MTLVIFVSIFGLQSWAWLLVSYRTEQAQFNLFWFPPVRYTLLGCMMRTKGSRRKVQDWMTVYPGVGGRDEDKLGDNLRILLDKAPARLISPCIPHSLTRQGDLPGRDLSALSFSQIPGAGAEAGAWAGVGEGAGPWPGPPGGYPPAASAPPQLDPLCTAWLGRACPSHRTPNWQ